MIPERTKHLENQSQQLKIIAEHFTAEEKLKEKQKGQSLLG